MNIGKVSSIIGSILPRRVNPSVHDKKHEAYIIVASERRPRDEDYLGTVF